MSGVPGLSSLSPLQGKMVRLEFDGSEAKRGRLLSAKGDCLVLQTKKQEVVYVNRRLLKGMAEETLEQSFFSFDGHHPHYLHTDSFDALLQRLKYNWVRINRGGPNRFSGMLIQCFGDHIVLVDEEEQVRTIPKAGIREICPGREEESGSVWEEDGTAYEQESLGDAPVLRADVYSGGEEESERFRETQSLPEKIQRHSIRIDKGTDGREHRILIEIRIV
jgi:spore coat protein B